MKQSLEMEIVRLIDRQMGSIFNRFDCPVCKHVTLACRGAVYREKMYCYVCGHIFVRKAPEWVEGE